MLARVFTKSMKSKDWQDLCIHRVIGSLNDGTAVYEPPVCYVSGPMTDVPDLNFPLFKQVTRALRDEGFMVYCPTEINPHQDTAWGECMRNDIRGLCNCTVIVMLPGWKNSKGATLEHHIAERLEMVVVELQQKDIDQLL